MNRKSKVIVSIVGITIVLLALLGLTYAYYLTRIEGNTNTNSISITTADLKLVYGDGNGLVSKENIMPGTTIEKTFTVTNSGNNKVDLYAVYLEELVNTLSRTPDLTYVLTCESTGEDCDGGEGEFPTLAGMIVTNSIDTDVTHTYKLTVTYKNEENIDQSIDMGSRISAFVQIYALKDIVDIEGSITGAADGDFAQINSVQKRSQIVDGNYKFAGVLPGTHTIKICSKEDTECTTPKLSKEIIINLGNESGVVDNKITITDNSQTATVNINLTETVEENKVNINTTINDYNPFKYGTLAYSILNNANNPESSTSTIYSKNPITLPGEEKSAENERVLSTTQDDYGTSYYFRGNIVDNYINFAGMCWRIVRIHGDGSIKILLEDKVAECNDNETLITSGVFTGNWLNEVDLFAYGIPQFLNNFENSKLSNKFDKLKSGDWCYDNSIASFEEFYYDSDSNQIYNKEEASYITRIENYEAYNRIFRNKKPTLICNGTKINSSYVGTLTADEMTYAGANNSRNQNFYLINNYIKEISNEGNGIYWWSLTPIDFNSESYYGSAFALTESGWLISDSSYNAYEYRPAITLKKGIILLNGKGTQLNPYVIE